MGSLLQDLKYGARMLRKSPGFSFICVLTLALGIGANSTIFSWINSTLLNPLPGVSRTRDLVVLTSGGTAQSPHVFSYPDYLDLRSRTKTLSGILATSLWPMDLTGVGRPERTWGTLVSANYFDLLGVRPILGRGFLPDDEARPGGAPVAVISYRQWKLRFAGEPNVIGKQLSINRHPYTIIGVAPPIFQGTQTGLRSELWLPLVMQADMQLHGDILQKRDTNWILLMGRLAPGMKPDQARQEVNVLMSQIVRQYPEAHLGAIQCGVYPLWRAPGGANAYFYVLLPMLLAIAGVVLLLACANVANLFLVRSVSRRKEMAVRLSLGASRWRLLRQNMVESLLLALAGGALAMAVTAWTSSSFGRFIPPAGIPLGLDSHMDGTVLLVTLAISILTALIFGVLPAARSSSLVVGSVLKEEAGTASGGIRKARLSTALVVTQISLSLLLLVCAGLIVRGFRKAENFYPGFNQNHMLLASFNLFSADYTEAQTMEFERELQSRLQALPGAQSAALADWIPMGFSLSTRQVAPKGYVPRPHEDMDVETASVSPAYFKTMEIPIVAGREFSAEDDAKAQPAIIINRAFAEKYFPGENAIGMQVDVTGKTFTVVGIAQTCDYDNLNEAPKPFFYRTILQDAAPMAAIHFRTSGDPLAAVSAVEKTVHDLNADVPVYDITTMDSRVKVASTGLRIAGTFVGAFGLLALVLAAVGIYGVVAYVTRQRTHEIGIRVALGAQRRDVLRLVLEHGLRLTLLGLAIGFAFALMLTRYIARLMFTVSPTDPWILAGVSLLLFAVALGACYLPARRAMRVDPMIALRYE